MRSQYRGTVGQADKDRTNVFQLQAEIENLLQHLCYMQDVNADLLSHVRVMKNATRKADAEKTKAEEQKNQQDLYVERLTKDLERLTEKMAVYEAQASTQAKETQAAKEVLSEVAKA
ncbi:coiled-coil domain-containing protein 40-like [Lampris incognitus]|uniref:coiled-coil domain-containing protein 40-like n=1 Tax=Lampris incognitus TaxID=2546036 RepID=UPI0024B4CE27|nr:coiled-coil domain-containing protein 40-like [Lampris incognitus]